MQPQMTRISSSGTTSRVLDVWQIVHNPCSMKIGANIPVDSKDSTYHLRLHSLCDGDYWVVSFPRGYRVRTFVRSFFVHTTNLCFGSLPSPCLCGQLHRKISWHSLGLILWGLAPTLAPLYKVLEKSQIFFVNRTLVPQKVHIGHAKVLIFAPLIVSFILRG